VIFGRHDTFVNRFAAMAKVFPAIPRPRLGRFQPICGRRRPRRPRLDDGGTVGKSFNLAKAHALREIVELRRGQCHPAGVPVPDGIARRR
jgi:hypothetical protein